MLTLWLSLALAQAPMNLEDVTRGIETAIALRKGGDPEEARELLVVLERSVGAEDRARLLFELGLCEELSWHPARARAHYEAVVALDGPRADEARFRLALVLEDLDEPELAFEQVKLLRRSGRAGAEALGLELQRGVSLVKIGRTRRGLRRIDAALALAEGSSEHSWLRAKARHSIASAHLERAARLRLAGGEKKVVKKLLARAGALNAAEEQILAIAALDEPEWVLEGLLALGIGLTDLADALDASPPPRRLTPEQAAIYVEQVGQHAQAARTRAWTLWDQGISMALRIGFESPTVRLLEARRDALDQ